MIDSKVVEENKTNCFNCKKSIYEEKEEDFIWIMIRKHCNPVQGNKNGYLNTYSIKNGITQSHIKICINCWENKVAGKEYSFTDYHHKGI